MKKASLLQGSFLMGKTIFRQRKWGLLRAPLSQENIG